MARPQEYDVTLDGVGLILTDEGLDVRRVQANPFAMKSSTGERTYADLDQWAVFQVDTLHRGMGQERYGDPEQFWYGVGVDTRYKGKVFLRPKQIQLTRPASKTGDVFYAKFGSKLFMSIDKEVYELVTTTWTLRETLTATCTGLCEFNGYLYAAQGSSNTLRKSANGTAWSDVGGTPSTHRIYVHGGYLYRSLNQVLYYSSDPDAGSPTWSSAINVDDSQYIVEGMITFDDSLIVFKNNAGYRIPGNPGEIDQAFKIGELDWAAAIDSNNGLHSGIWSDGFLYVTVGKGGLLRWTGKTVSPIGPDMVSAGPVAGRIWSIVPTLDFLYILVGEESTQAVWIAAWNGSGWHPFSHLGQEGRAIYYFDSGTGQGGELYITTYNSSTTSNDTFRHYIAGETGDPTKALDASYEWTDGAITQNYLYTSRFTAGMHAAQKEYKEVVLWAESLGTAGAGTQQIRIEYRIDTELSTDWVTLVTQTIEASASAQKSYTTAFPVSSFAEKTLTSVVGRTVTLATGTTADMSADDWVYFVDVNEYRMVESVINTSSFGIQCNLDGSPAAGSIIRPGLPWGRYIQFRLSFYTSVDTRTPILRALALKYLVNITDYDIWTINVLVADPKQRRNQASVREPVADQLTRLNEIRRKGRVPFVDEVGDSHTVKVSNYSLIPIRQDTASGQTKPHTEYHARLTLLEV